MKQNPPRVPRLTSPCPLRWKSAPQPGQDFCGQCQRRVHNLDLLSADQRDVFLARCEGEVCVAYTVRRPAAPLVARGALGAALLATAALSASVNAEEPLPQMTDSPYCLTELLVGGTEAGEKLQWVDESEAKAQRPDLPEIDAQDWLPTPES